MILIPTVSLSKKRTNCLLLFESVYLWAFRKTSINNGSEICTKTVRCSGWILGKKNPAAQQAPRDLDDRVVRF